MARNSDVKMRVSKEFMQLLRMAKAKALMSGKKIPSNKKLTLIIARKLKKEGIEVDEFVKY